MSLMGYWTVNQVPRKFDPFQENSILSLFLRARMALRNVSAFTQTCPRLLLVECWLNIIAIFVHPNAVLLGKIILV